MTEIVYDVSLLPGQLARRITIDPITGCWLWNGKISQRGGYVQVTFKRLHYTWHRLIYTLLVGPIPDGLELDHVAARGCRYRHCANPAHLEPVTRRVNTLRSTAFTAANAEKTHCPAGHLYDEANTRWYRGRRACRACEFERSRRRGGWKGGAWKGGPPMAERTHCPQGHEYTPENTYNHPNGGRVCRICVREAQQRYRERKRAKAA